MSLNPLNKTLFFNLNFDFILFLFSLSFNKAYHPVVFHIQMDIWTIAMLYLIYLYIRGCDQLVNELWNNFFYVDIWTH